MKHTFYSFSNTIEGLVKKRGILIMLIGPLDSPDTIAGLLIHLSLPFFTDEAFVTGTFAGLAPVREIDGRVIGDGERGPMVEQLQQLYLAMLEQECR